MRLRHWTPNNNSCLFVLAAMSRRGTMSRQSTVKPKLENVTDTSVLDLYYKNPTSLEKLFKNEIIKKSNLFQSTVFEEVDVYDMVDTLVSTEKGFFYF
jgi:hypothetical protein